MTPVPKGLSKKQVLAWRTAIRLGINPVKAAKIAKKGQTTRFPTS